MKSVLPYTGTRHVPDYFCLIPEQSRPVDRNIKE